MLNNGKEKDSKNHFSLHNPIYYLFSKDFMDGYQFLFNFSYMTKKYTIISFFYINTNKSF